MMNRATLLKRLLFPFGGVLTIQTKKLLPVIADYINGYEVWIFHPERYAEPVHKEAPTFLSVIDLRYKAFRGGFTPSRSNFQYEYCSGQTRTMEGCP